MRKAGSWGKQGVARWEGERRGAGEKRNRGKGSGDVEGQERRPEDETR